MASSPLISDLGDETQVCSNHETEMLLSACFPNRVCVSGCIVWGLVGVKKV